MNKFTKNCFSKIKSFEKLDIPFLKSKIDFSEVKKENCFYLARNSLIICLCLLTILSIFNLAPESVAIDTLDANTNTNFTETQNATYIVPLIEEVEKSELVEDTNLSLNANYVKEVEEKEAEAERKAKAEAEAKKKQESLIAPPVSSSKGFVQYDVPLSREWQLYTYNLCQEYGVSFEVMLGLMYAESTFRFDCVSYNGSSYGICQINKCHESYAKSLGMDDFKEPKNNIKLAVMFMKGHLNNNNGDYHKALVCYNCGAYGAKTSYFNKGVYQSNYSRKVINYANNLKVA